MGVAQQQGTWYQASRLAEDKDDERHAANSEGGTGAEASEEQQTLTALDRARALTSDLMERICARTNLNRA